MAEISSFNNIFSSLTPLRRSATGDKNDKRRKPLFRLVIDGGEPLIEPIDENQSRHDMSVAESRLMDEIIRIAEMEDAYSLSDSNLND
ncbi:MAG: hypothetical protein K2J78_00530, partial [Muribaculaceae bacterium]|nr:hypothetical protein [Muribaculaceae bacterium]